MKTTYFTESTTTVKVQSFYNQESKVLVNYMDNTVFINTLDTLEVALVNNQCNHIRIELYRDNEKILNGNQWIDYFNKYDKEALNEEVYMQESESDYFDYELWFVN